MDGLEDRVRRALGAGALAADPSLVDVDAVHAGVAARRRRRLAVASTAGVMALLAVGAVALNQQDKAKPSRVATEPAPTEVAAPDDRVPWLAVPPVMPPTPGPSPSELPTARECGRDDVTLEATEQTGGAGHLYTTATLRNASSSACTLSGSPGLSVASDGTGGGEVQHGEKPGFGGRTPATMEPGDVAYVSLDAQQGCRTPERTYAKIGLVLKDGYPIRIPETLTSTCPLVVSPWYLAPTPGAAPLPADSVVATIERAPLRPTAGTTLDYTVKLTNPSAQPVTLDCPGAYTQLITDGTHTTAVTYGMNCAGWAGHVGARGSVRLQMKLDIPEGLTTVKKFEWGLEGTSITADGLGSGQVVTLHHCGINNVEFDGQTWEILEPPFDETNAPDTFTGFGNLQREGAVLHFVDDAGATLKFTLDDGVPPAGHCA